MLKGGYQEWKSCSRGSWGQLRLLECLTNLPNFYYISNLLTDSKRIARENSHHFVMPALVSPQNNVGRTSAEIPYQGHISAQIWFWLVEMHRSGQWCAIRMDFWHWFLRHHFVGKLVVALWNVVCVLRLHVVGEWQFFCHDCMPLYEQIQVVIAKITLKKCFVEQVVSFLSVDCKAFFRYPEWFLGTWSK